MGNRKHVAFDVVCRGSHLYDDDYVGGTHRFMHAYLELWRVKDVDVHDYEDDGGIDDLPAC